MPEIRKVRMKLGDAEFEAEVAADEVQAMYDQFLAAVRAGGSAKKPAEVADSTHHKDNNGDTPPPAGSVDEALMARLFDQRQDGVVALRLLPKGTEKDADALLLLLLGYRRLKNEEDVLATQLLKAASYSGLRVDRLSRLMATHERYVITGGQRKGTTYTLNNQGVTKAEEIAAQIFT